MADRISSACGGKTLSYVFMIYPKQQEVTMDGGSEGEAARKLPVVFGVSVTKAVAIKTGTVYKF